MIPILSLKRECFRSNIRKLNQEEYFSKKRVVEQQDAEKKNKSQKLELEIERYAAKFLEDQLQMSSLIQTIDQPKSMKTLLNLCAAEARSTVAKLINEYKIHEILMQQIALHSGEINQQAEYAFLAAANLLFSDTQQIEHIITFFLENHIIHHIIRQRQRIEERNYHQKEHLLRLTIAVLKLMKKFRLQRKTTQVQMIDLFTMCLNWYDQSEEYCSIAIIIISQDLKCLLELVDEQRMQNFMKKIQNYSGTNEKLCSLTLSLVVSLFESSDAHLIVVLLDNSDLDGLVKQLLASKCKQIVRVVFQLIRCLIDKENQELIAFCQLIFDELLKCITQSYDESLVIEGCFTLKQMILECNESQQSEAKRVIDTIFEKLSAAYYNCQTQVMVELLENLEELFSHIELCPDQHQLIILERLWESSNEKVSEEACKIMQLF